VSLANNIWSFAGDEHRAEFNSPPAAGHSVNHAGRVDVFCSAPKALRLDGARWLGRAPSRDAFVSDRRLTPDQSQASSLSRTAPARGVRFGSNAIVGISRETSTRTSIAVIQKGGRRSMPAASPRGPQLRFSEFSTVSGFRPLRQNRHGRRRGSRCREPRTASAFR
jgi:hypothetical protein